MSRNHDAGTLDHGGPKLRVEEEAGTLDHSDPKLTVEEAKTLDHDGPKMKAWGGAGTLDHGGPKLIEKGDADMGDQKRPFVAETEDRITDQEQLPETGGCILYARHGRALTGESPEHAQVVGSV